MQKKEKAGILSGLYDMITGQEDSYADGFMREICGVSRGRQCPDRFYPLFNQKVFADTLCFRWDSCGPGYRYQLTISTDTAFLADTIAFYTTTDSSLTVRLQDNILLQKGKKYFWKLEDVTYMNQIEWPFTVMDQNERNNYLLQADKRSSDSKGDEISSILIKAAYLEANGLYNDSRKVFEELISRYPKDERLKEVFKMYKLRVGYE